MNYEQFPSSGISPTHFSFSANFNIRFILQFLRCITAKGKKNESGNFKSAIGFSYFCIFVPCLFSPRLIHTSSYRGYHFSKLILTAISDVSKMFIFQYISLIKCFLKLKFKLKLRLWILNFEIFKMMKFVKYYFT